MLDTVTDKGFNFNIKCDFLIFFKPFNFSIFYLDQVSSDVFLVFSYFFIILITCAGFYLVHI